MATDDQKLEHLGFFYAGLGYGPVRYCSGCFQMFYFHWGTSVAKAEKHREVCPLDD